MCSLPSVASSRKSALSGTVSRWTRPSRPRSSCKPWWTFSPPVISPVTSTIAAEYVDYQGWRGQELDGVDGFSEVVQVARRSYVVLEISIEDLIAEGNRAARIRWHGTDSAGPHSHRETIDIIRVADGRAVEHWVLVPRPLKPGPTELDPRPSRLRGVGQHRLRSRRRAAPVASTVRPVQSATGAANTIHSGRLWSRCDASKR